MILQRPIFGDKIKYRYIRYDGKGGIVSQFFGENRKFYYDNFKIKGHNGIDFVCKDGEPIFAAHDGKVILTFDENNSTSTRGYGIYLINDEKNHFTTYWHLKDVLVKVGDIIKAGQLLGHADNTGFSSGTHLHFGLTPCNASGAALYPDNGYRGAIDPMPFFSIMLKIIGDRRDKKQYLLGNDKKLRWIFNPNLLNELHNAGVINASEVDWKDNLNEFVLGDTWAVLK